MLPWHEPAMVRRVVESVPLTISTKVVRDVRVIHVAQLLDAFFAVDSVFIVEESGQVLESLVPSGDRILRELPERHLLGIVVHVRHCRVNVLLIEDEFHQRLD